MSAHAGKTQEVSAPLKGTADDTLQKQLPLSATVLPFFKKVEKEKKVIRSSSICRKQLFEVLPLNFKNH